MSTKHKISVMLSVAASMATILPANAGDCITRTTTYVTPAETLQVVPQPLLYPQSVIVPQSIGTTLLPTQTVKTTKTTVTTTPVIQPTIVTTPDSVSRTVIMMGSTPATSSSSMVTTTDVGPYPVYGNRLSAMNEQIDRSLANGWISQFQADNLRNESSRLNTMIIARSSNLSDTDVLERRLTGLNLAIQDAMKTSGHTATVIQRTY
jgi:hypothetical protein